LHRYFENFKNSLTIGTKLILYVIEDKKKEISPDFIICNPGTGEHSNQYTTNPSLIKKRWREKFENPLNTIIEEFLKPSTAQNSPIMEMFQVVALSAFPSTNDSVKKRIIIISDMLHHTPEWSHYRSQLDIGALKKTAYYQKVGTDLQNASVEILYVRRDGMDQVQTKRHALFWADYIESIGGRVVLIERIDG
jgi:hypothetical protein